MATTAKRRRMPDFTVDETRALVQKFVENFELLRAKQSTAAITGMKREVYEQITAAVNAVGVGGRSVDSVKDKWQTLKKNVKMKYQLYKQQATSENTFIKTEDGCPEAINTTAFEDWERQLISILPIDQLEVSHIETYNDTYTESPNTTTPDVMQEAATETENGISNEIPMCDTSDDLPVTQRSQLVKSMTYSSGSLHKKKEKKSTTKDTDEITSSSYYSRMIAIEEEKLAIQKEMFDLKKWYYEKKIEALQQQQQPKHQVQQQEPKQQLLQQSQKQPQQQLLQQPQEPATLIRNEHFLKIPVDD